MPEVERVRPLADPDQGRQGEDARQQRARRHQAAERDHRQHRDQGDAAVVAEAGVALGAEHQGHDRDDGAGAHEADPQARASVFAEVDRGDAPHGGAEGEPAAEQQAHRARVGAVVGAGGVLAGRVEHGHQHGGRDGAGDQQAADAAPGHAEAQQQDEQRRPDEVELPLDGERPVVGEGRGRARCVEVGDLGRRPGASW